AASGRCVSPSLPRGRCAPCERSPTARKILPTFCLLSVTAASRILADTITGNADKIDTSRRPPSSTAVRTTNSHGENRGSSPLGSASKIRHFCNWPWLGCNTGVISLPDVSRYQRATPTRMRGRLTRLPVHVSRRRFVMDQPDHRRCNHRLDIAIAERPAMQAQLCCDPLIRCPLLGVKRTLIGCRGMSAFDPKRTFAIQKEQNTFVEC